VHFVNTGVGASDQDGGWVSVSSFAGSPG